MTGSQRDRGLRKRRRVEGKEEAEKEEEERGGENGKKV